MSCRSSSRSQTSTFVVMGRCVRRDDSGACVHSAANGCRSRAPAPELLRRFRKAVVECVARAAYGADRILLAARIEQLAQAADMHVDGALVDVDVTAPDAV